MQKSNISTYRAQKVDVGNEGIRLVAFMFTTKVMVIRMSKMINFTYFLLNQAKSQSQSGQDI